MDTDARFLARQYYQHAGRNMDADLSALAANPQGIVVMLPRLVVLMKSVQSRQPDQWAELADAPEQADAWYVHLLVGDLQLARALAVILPPRRWLCFQRGLRNNAPHRLPWLRTITTQH
ncbi:MAG: hypothetical protein IKA23_07520 [Akkermansia sp.]|nr:hypothetical protein [Akkermansia sp.]